MGRHGTAQPEAGARRATKRPRKITARSLENIALHYLKRYSSTVTQLRRVLSRRIERSFRAHGGDRKAVSEWLDAVIAKLERNGLVDDARYAETRAQVLRSGGRSARMNTQKLRLKGVAAPLAAAKVADAAREVSEGDAARIWARKKRLGPFRRDLATRSEHRQRNLAALARAGFSYAVARAVIDAPVA